ncbi:transposase family protein [Rothia dentocariosa]
MYLRQNQTEEFLAEDFGVSQPTISRILKRSKQHCYTS